MSHGRWMAAVLAGWVAACTCSAPAAPPAAVPAQIWFDDLSAPVTVSEADGIALLRYAAGRLRGDVAPPAPPAGLRDGRPAAMVFLSVSDGRRSARVLVGTGRGLIEAVDGAVAKASLFAGTAQWVKLDVVTSVKAFPAGQSDEMRKIGPSLHGLAFARADAPVLVPEALAADPPAVAALPLGTQTSYRFTTAGFFSDGRREYALFRGHRRPGAPDARALLASAKSAGAYLARIVNAGGMFAYTYDAGSGQVASDYNILRHAGTIFAMMHLYRVTGDKELLAAARRAEEYLLRAVKPALPDPDRIACIVEGRYTKLGGAALAILALTEDVRATGDRRHMEVLTRLGRYVLSCMGPDGEFVNQSQTYPGGRVTDLRSEYYPGEAMFALVRLASLDKRDEWLDGAERAARFLIRVRDRDEVIHDHWQLYALNELYRVRPKDAYLRHSKRIADAIVGAQRTKGEYPDWVGSFETPPRSTPTSTRMEGLAAAYALLRDFGKPGDTKGMLEALKRGASYQMQLQILPESAMYMKDPRRSLGGIRRSFSNYHVRIDNVQHYISAMLGLREVLTHK